MSENSTPHEENKINRYGVNAVARHQFTALITAGLVFLGAGTWDWPWAWVFAVVCFVGWLIVSVALWHYSPALLNVRGKQARQMAGTKSWDWILLSLYSILMLVQPFVAGLDFRNKWSGPASPVVMVAGNGLLLAAFALLAWSMVANRNFEAMVRIQGDRGHAVAASGPYRCVRHPGYVSVILTFVAMPMALGAWAAMIPGLIGVVGFVIRTALEDRTLQAELDGYADFAQQTRYRLLPGLW